MGLGLLALLLVLGSGYCFPKTNCKDTTFFVFVEILESKGMIMHQKGEKCISEIHFSVLGNVSFFENFPFF